MPEDVAPIPEKVPPHRSGGGDFAIRAQTDESAAEEPKPSRVT